MPQYDGSVRFKTVVETREFADRLYELVGDIKQTGAELSKLQEKQNSLAKVSMPTKEYAALQKQVEALDDSYIKILDKQIRFQKTGGDINSSTYQKMEYDLRQIQLAADKARNAMVALENSGGSHVSGIDTEEYAHNAEKIKILTQNLTRSKLELKELVKGMNPIPAILKRAANAARKMFSFITSGVGRSNRATHQLAARMKDVALSMLLFDTIRKVFDKTVEKIKEGFVNLTKYSSEYADSVQGLKGSMNTLGNQFAATFAPIAQMVIPSLSGLIDAVSAALTYISRLIAVLGGKSTFTRAKKIQDDYNQSLGGTAKAADKARGALAKFDDLDVWTKQEAASGGGSVTGDLFEEVPIENEWKNFADWLRNMWESSDFTELGTLLGEKLKSSLDNIPWDGIKASARNIGQSIATYINGFIEVEKLGYSIGNTLSQAFNTGFEFLNSFVHSLHWKSVGSFLADSINGVFENVDWTLIRDTFITGVKGISDAINSLVDELNWSAVADTVLNGFNIIVDSVSQFFDSTDFHKIGQEFGTLVSEALSGIEWGNFGEAFTDVAHNVLEFISGALEELDWATVGESIRDMLAGIDWLTLLQDVGHIIAETLDGILIAAFTALGGDGDALTKRWEEGKKVREEEQKDFGAWAANMEKEAGLFAGRMKENLSDPQIWDTSAGLAMTGESLLAFMETCIMPLIENLKLMWISFKEWLSELWITVSENLSGAWDEISTFFSDTWEHIKEKAVEIWTNIQTTFSQKMELIKIKAQTVINRFNELKKNVADVFDNVKRTITGAIDTVVGKLDGFITKIREAIQAVKDFMSSGFENARNAFNSSGYSNFASAYSGNSTAAAYSVRSITSEVPHLASGAVIRGGNPFLAMLGDQRRGQTNIEAPLSTIRQAVHEELNGMGLGNGVPVKINLNYDGVTFAEYAIPDFLKEMHRQGYDLDVIGVSL